jgi:sugar transferase EpsL
MPRWLELALIILTAPVWLPVMAIIAALVALRLGRPVLFRQARAGRDDRPFNLMKFRTMTDERGADGKLLPDAARLTGFGTWLRSTSLDELPELLNVLRGDMSLVGPRPLLMEYVPLYSARHRRRHSVRPGLTGWAQINGRNALPWPERFDLDVWYVENRSLWLDVRILARTVWKVLRPAGISAPGEATMHAFNGYGSSGVHGTDRPRDPGPPG